MANQITYMNRWSKLLPLVAAMIFTFSLKANAQSFLHKISKVSEFAQFSGKPLSAKYGQVEAIKILYNLDQQQLYFINSNHFDYHYAFCFSMFNLSEDLSVFNEYNYSQNKRRAYLLGNVNFYPSSGFYVLELSPVDLMSEEHILLLYQQLKKSAYFGDSLKLLINSVRLQECENDLPSEVQMIHPDKIYNNLKYQAIGNYKGRGRLKFIHDLKLEESSIRPEDIIIIKETPLYLPLVAGVIVAEFQTPLSHLSILAQNRKIPVFAFKEAFQDKELLALGGQFVELDVQVDTYKIRSVNGLKKDKGKRKGIKLKYDLSQIELLESKDLTKKAHRYVGNKAANFGILQKISEKGNFKTPESSFAIPFHYYHDHMDCSGSQVLIDSLITLKDSLLSMEEIKARLKAIRKQIKKAPIDSMLVVRVERKIRSLGQYSRMRFRSSTNAEDTKGFSGAGLYTSKTGIVGDHNKPIDLAIKKVWASLWSYEAYMEREYFNIDYQQVFMGILVHRSFPEECVNGVAITKNLYREEGLGFVVNAQLGDESVVKPSPGTTCDQFVCYPSNTATLYDGKTTIDIISTSSLGDGQLLMTKEEIQNLANQLNMIKHYFYTHSSVGKHYMDYGLDLEFKLDGGERQLYIKQVRPFND